MPKPTHASEMVMPSELKFPSARHTPRKLSPSVATLGLVSMLTAISSAMIYGLLPLFMVKVLAISVASVGFIEGMAEAANSVIKIVSGAASDYMRRRKPIVLFGYTLSAIIKTIFPIAETAFTILTARVIDRLGKGIRDAPRDAFLADLTIKDIRGQGFGLRLSLAISGFVLGPFIAIFLMKFSGDDFRVGFLAALIPAYLAIIVLLLAVKEFPSNSNGSKRSFSFHASDIKSLSAAFWWVIAIASVLSLARYSQAFLVLKASDIGLDSAFVPMALVVAYLAFSLSAYPFGILADRINRRYQLELGALVLIGADLVLLSASKVWFAAVGAALWGLQLGITQGLLGAVVADIAPDRVRGTAFGLYDFANGIGAFLASSAAGFMWMTGGPSLAFGFSACVATVAALMLLVCPLKTSTAAA
jgi:MFS family permease